MKKRVNFIIGAILLLFVAVSCTKKPAYLKVIPANSSVVCLIDSKSLAKKSGIDNETKLKDLCLKEVGTGLSNDLVKLLGEFMDDPECIGVDFSEPIAVFENAAMEQGVWNSTMASVVKMDDIKAFENLLKLMREDDSNETSEITVADGFSYVVIEEGFNLVVAAYNKDLILFVPAMYYYKNKRDECLVGLVELTKGLMNQSEANSFVESKKYAEMRSLGGDILMSVNYSDNLFDYSRSMKRTAAQLNMLGHLNDVSLLYGVSFDAGELSVEYAVYSENENFNEMVKTASKICKDVDGDLFSKLPSTTLGLMTFNIDGDEIYSYIMSDEALSKELNQASTDDREFLEALLDVIEGDVIISCLGIDDNGGGADLLAYISVENGAKAYELLQEITTKIRSCEADGDNGFVYSGGIYVGVTGDLVYITNSRRAKANVGKKIEKSMKDVKTTLKASNYIDYTMINAESLMSQSLVKEIISKLIAPTGVLDYLYELKTIELGSGISEGELKVVYDNDENPLEKAVKAMSSMI